MKYKSKKYLGVGWRFPIQVNDKGGIATSAYEESIEQSIRLILGTALGERVMRPRFGAAVHDYVFHPNSPTTASFVAGYALQALAKWEPRIDQITTSAYASANSPNVLTIEITYKVIADNTWRNLVYPFYLRREQDI